MEYSFFVFSHALFLLGGVFFKKFHFIATAATFVLIYAGWATVYNAFGFHDKPVLTQSEIDVHYFTTFAVFLSLAALFTWLAYRLFCRWQVVTNKFVNV